MALQVIVGSANAGKTGLAHQGLRDRIAAGGSGALVLPSEPDVARARAELAAEVPIGLTISTFDALLDRLWAEMAPGIAIVNGTRRLLILADIVTSATFDVLGPSAGSPGFLGALAAFVQRSAGVARVDATSGPGVGLGAEIASLVLAYQRRLTDEGLVERAEAHRRVASAPPAALLPDVIAINRFTGFTSAQEAFVLSVAPSREVIVTLTYDEGVPATRAAAAFVERLAAAGEAVLVSPRQEHSTSAELVRIERSLGCRGSGEVAAEGAVVLSEAWGPEAEAARIVREAQDAIAGGVAAGQIAVAFREPGRHVRALRTALDEAGLDADWDMQARFDASRLGRALLMLLGFYGGTRSTTDLMDVLRSGYAPAANDALDALDVRLRASGPMSARAFERECARLDTETGAFLAEIRRAARSLGEPGSERLWWRIVGRMMSCARPGAPILDVDGLLDAAAQRTFIEAITEAVTGGDRVSASDVATALGAARVTVASPDRPDRIQVMSVERLRGRRYQCVIIGGLVAGEFPRLARDDAFTSPAIRTDLARTGLDVPPGAGLDEERLMFYQAVTRARGRLVLSWQSHDADGKSVRPSVFLDELLDLYRDPVTGEWGSGAPPHHVLGLDETIDGDAGPSSVRVSLRRAAVAGTEGASASERGRLAHARYRVRTRSACLGEPARAALASRESFSVTDIETYIQCPFRWYVERVLRPVEIDVHLDAAASGRLAHEIMGDVYDEFTSRTGASRIVPDSLPQALEVHAQVADAAVARVGTAGASEDASVRAVVRHTARLLEADATLLPGFAPRHREWCFGIDEDDEPERFEGFSLVGRIDRIDTDGHRLIVTDYKLGTVGSNRSRNAFEAKGLLQLPLYTAVAARRLGLEAAGGVYRSIRGGRPRGFVRDDIVTIEPGFVRTDVVDAEEIAALVDRAVEVAREAVSGMRAGEIPARPLARPCPAYCTARMLCSKRGDGSG